MSPLPDPHFDPYAHTYHELHRVSVRASGEEPDYFAAYKIEYMSRLLRAEADQKLDILDFGCGIGTSIPHLARFFPHARIYGCDISGESINIAKVANPQAQFGVITTAGLDLPDASVDVAIAACVYHHIAPADRMRWAQELRRVVKPGGQVFIFEHNPLNPLTRKVVRECPFDNDAILLSGAESIGLLKDCDFSSPHLSYIVFFPKLLAVFRPLERHMGRLPLGAQYVAHARVA